MLHETLFFKYSPFIFFIRNPWIYTDDMYSFSHSYMHVTLFEIQKASRQCSIQTSLAVSPLSSDEMASSNPAKETGLAIRGRCTYNKNTEFFFFQKRSNCDVITSFFSFCCCFLSLVVAIATVTSSWRSGSGPTNLTTSKTIWRALLFSTSARMYNKMRSHDSH